MIFGKKIGEGEYRECYEIESQHNLCAKKLKETRDKKYFGITIKYKLQVYTLLKFGIRDINNFEIDIVNSLPEELKTFFPKIHKDNDLLICDRPIDFNGEHSKLLSDYGKKVSDPKFWEDIEKITSIMDKNKLWFFDIFHCGNNIMIQETSKGVYKPIIIDCKRIGWSGYPFQLNLILESQRKRKFYRKLERFKKRFK